MTMNPAVTQFPSWISPEIIPGLPFRWYGLMYLVAFGITYLLFRWQVRREKLLWSEDEIANFFLVAILGLIVGARLLGTFLYEPTGLYWRKPWLVIWPFDEAGRFTGFQGMSYHGGALGLIVSTLIYARKRKLDYMEWADRIAVSVPLGYTFGRLGNFINGELWGKVTAGRLGMVFPHAERFPASEEWVQAVARKAGMVLDAARVNLPRHPSQLYEAFFEGIVLWLVLWLVVRPRKPYKGFSVGAYIIGYGVIRFVIEYFREPDSGLGYIIKLGDPAAPIHTFTTLWNFSMGQILCFLMIVGGVVFLLCMKKASERAAAAAAVQAQANAPDRRRKEARKLRKKLS
jgi:phosphatidylglycerol:prolipoprotein diacylglycerol transferase